MALSVLAKTTELAWTLLESYKIDPLPLFRKARIDPKQMSDMSSRISQSAADNLWNNVAAVVNNPCFGLRVGQLWHPSYMHALGYAWMASSTLRTALQRLARYIHVANQAIVIELEEKDGQFSVAILNSARNKDPYWLEDGNLAILMAMCRANYGDSLDPIAVSFTHKKPDCAGDFFEYFRCPVEFNAKKCQLVLASESIDKRLPSSNPLLSQITDQEIIKYLAKLDENDIVQRVKATIIELLPDGKVTDEKVADTIFMSERTLQRKLQDVDTTFKKIMKDVRKELALKYIQDRQLTLTELSFQLGFSEISAFSRAFKGWTGLSPREYRKST